MRRVRRLPLDQDIQADLDARQAAANQSQDAGTLNVESEWRNARQTNALKAVLGTLHRMMGDRQRCMYCLDSHGTDIEHFWPKKPFPLSMFVWPNLLLCCTECGRCKGDKFPLSDGQPLLIDPTAEDPWLHLDFDPVTGNIVAKFSLSSNDYSTKGAKTVEVLHLDQREALAAGCLRTFRRLAQLVEEALNQPNMSAARLAASLCEADEHGLLGWCFRGSGHRQFPFSELCLKHPTVWNACIAALDL